MAAKNIKLFRDNKITKLFIIFTGFKDFTKNTGKLGLSFGERFAFWCYGKAKGLSTNVFTHIFLLIIVCIYCALGGFIFFIFENEEREKLVVRHKLEDSEIFNRVTSVSLQCLP